MHGNKNIFLDAKESLLLMRNRNRNITWTQLYLFNKFYLLLVVLTLFSLKVLFTIFHAQVDKKHC